MIAASSIDVKTMLRIEYLITTDNISVLRFRSSLMNKSGLINGFNKI